MLLLQSCNVAGFWIYYLMSSETCRGSWFYPHASVDIVARLFVMILGFCFHLFSYYSDSRLVQGYFSMATSPRHILFFCSLAREKLAVGYFSKATLLPAIIGLDRFAACAWTAYLMIYDAWICSVIVILIMAFLMNWHIQSCIMHSLYVIVFVCSSLMIITMQWTVPIVCLGIRISIFSVLFY